MNDRLVPFPGVLGDFDLDFVVHKQSRDKGWVEPGNGPRPQRMQAVAGGRTRMTSPCHPELSL